MIDHLTDPDEDPLLLLLLGLVSVRDGIATATAGERDDGDVVYALLGLVALAESVERWLPPPAGEAASALRVATGDLRR